mmetsp:Transcript_13821/g.45445  ORF Transcript_13821/g.45445 Transcript_13821/m.45445 type:complete len:198 (-) Transcript_13821:79-672(-)|eukprot:CAMPEP_0170141178 /NCGR_PEP_ID=MMETSP0033_2-20121228/6831_1 /TAXON_ID=195969 /ORGANISM="Dolichomastix tenuilepis, Strain CCMP3274" /LENGTH=197 /DNA_ID=CAMNT_0010377429 /DNA_START=34 /DNA_END=627 /DNA_ORIENTATION=+
MEGKVVVVDCRKHLLGRLASIIAKQLLTGQHVVCVRTESICISGGIVRQKMKWDRFKRLRMNTCPSKGPFHYRAPARMLWRTVRGMIPHKTARGAEAMKRFKAYEGIPAPYDKMKRACVPEALKVLRMKVNRKFCTLGQLATLTGWKHAETLASLEEARSAKAKAFYVESKKVRAARVAAAEAAAGEISKLDNPLAL